MASPAEITPQLPDTLPEDFGEWDGGGSPATLPVHSDDQQADSEFGSDPKALAEAPEPQPEAAPRPEIVRGAPSPSAAKIFAEGEAFLQRQKFKGAVDLIPEIPVPPQIVNPQIVNPQNGHSQPRPAQDGPTPLRRTTDPVIPKAAAAPAPAAVAPVLRETDEALFRSFHAPA